MPLVFAGRTVVFLKLEGICKIAKLGIEIGTVFVYNVRIAVHCTYL